MKRGKTTVLYRFLPSMLVDFHNCIIQISAWDCSEIHDINKTRVVYKVDSNVRKFKGKTKGFPRKPNFEDYAILEPKRVEGRVRPLTFLCNNNECNAAFSFYPNDAHKVTKKFGRDFRCPRCKTGTIYQWDMVYVDADGTLDFVTIPASFSNKDSVRLIRDGKKPSTWRWLSEATGNKVSLNRRNPATDAMMYPKPFRASSVIYPLTEDFINISNEDEDQVLRERENGELKIADYLGLLQKHNTSMQEISNATSARNGGISVDQTLQTMRDNKVPDSVIETIIRSLRAENPDQQSKKKAVLEEVKCIFVPDSDDHYLAVVLEVFDYMETLSLPDVREIEDVVKESQDERKPNASKVKTFPNKLRQVGVEKAYIVKDLSVLSTVYGFTRKENDPQKAFLNRFHTSETDDDDPRTPIFATQKRTEAILFQFDRMLVLRWLAKNGIGVNFEELKNEETLKSWFLNNIKSEEIPRFSSIESDANEATRLTYNLLHSMSHALLKQAADQCGYEQGSLGEIIMASIPAVIFYYKAASDFQIGGLHNLFENFIVPWIDNAQDSVRSCIYDPLCKNDTGACHACLFISEGSCIHFNKDLGRQYLVGSKKDNIVGFWKSSFRKEAETGSNGL
jgi:hypothetical protein